MTFVLVHGAWHGGWCWNKVAPLLRRTGAVVYTPTLSGLGERAHLAGLLEPSQVNLDLHIQDVVRLMEYEGLDNVALVGHAYAGMVITGVAEAVPERLSHLVYVNGVIPADGESMADQLVPVRGPEFAAWVRGHIERGEGYLPSPASPEEIGRRLGHPRRRRPGVDVLEGYAAACRSHGRAGAHRKPGGAGHTAQLHRRRGGRVPACSRPGPRGRVGGCTTWIPATDPMVSHPREMAEILLGIGASF